MMGIRAVEPGVVERLSRLLLLLCLSLCLSEAAAEPSQFLETPFPPADGFDSPQPRANRVVALANGRVLEAEQGRVEVEHFYYLSADRRVVRSSYGPLRQVAVRPGQLLKRGDKVGTRADGLRIVFSSTRGQVLSDALPRRAFVPQLEPFVVVVSQDRNLLETYAFGELQQRFEVGFGQAEGQKRRQGDLKTPRGMYFVIAKSQGPFTGMYGSYYGGHWIKLNYPSAADASWGFDNGVLTAETARQIEQDWAARRPTAQGTRLGGGIGFHGWASEWSLGEDGGRLSWGCVVLHLRDIAAFYAQVPLGAMVILR